jgi:hypothetical protein
MVFRALKQSLPMTLVSWLGLVLGVARAPMARNTSTSAALIVVAAVLTLTRALAAFILGVSDDPLTPAGILSFPWPHQNMQSAWSCHATYEEWVCYSELILTLKTRISKVYDCFHCYVKQTNVTLEALSVLKGIVKCWDSVGTKDKTVSN